MHQTSYIAASKLAETFKHGMKSHLAATEVCIHPPKPPVIRCIKCTLQIAMNLSRLPWSLTLSSRRDDKIKSFGDIEKPTIPPQAQQHRPIGQTITHFY
jgi:hypothetical protein